MDDFSKYRQVAQQRKEGSQKQYEAESANRLSKILAKRFNTAIIGLVASVESHFGERLWGHSKKERTDAEKAWFELWQQLRKEMLDKGNHQLRASLEELNQYSVKWNRYVFKGNNNANQ